MVRLLSPSGDLIGTTEIRVPSLRRRTIRHGGILYELVAEDAQGVRDYRATEAIPLLMPRSVSVIDAAGNECGAVVIEGSPLPEAVTFQGRSCPLWSSHDQTGRAVYRLPDEAA